MKPFTRTEFSQSLDALTEAARPYSPTEVVESGDLETMLTAWRAWRETGSEACRDVALQLADDNRLSQQQGDKT